MNDDLSTVQLSDDDLDEYARDNVESWDMDSLVVFAIDTLYSNLQKMYRENKKHLLNEMAEYYGEDWLREKKLQAFK